MNDLSGFNKDINKKIMDKLMNFFDYDIGRVLNFFKTEHPLLEYMSPEVMIRIGKQEQVLQLIYDQYIKL